jgi:hypothetical protein
MGKRKMFEFTWIEFEVHVSLPPPLMDAAAFC